MFSAMTRCAVPVTGLILALVAVSCAAPVEEPGVHAPELDELARRVREHPDDVRAHFAFVDAFIVAGAYHELVAELTRWLDRHEDCYASWLALAQARLDPAAPADVTDLAGALDAAKAARAQCADPPPVLLVTLGTAHYVNGDLTEAIEAYDAALATAAAADLDCADELRAWVAAVRVELAGL